MSDSFLIYAGILLSDNMANNNNPFSDNFSVDETIWS